MTTDQWPDMVTNRSRVMPELAQGHWHGYENDCFTSPLRGRYVIMRWKHPTVAISHEDQEELLRLACRIETTLQRFYPDG